MKNTILILTIMTFNSVYGQTGFTSYSIDFPLQDSLEVPIVDINKTNYHFYFRLLLNGQTVEIFSQDNTTYDGKIINSIKEYNRVKIDDNYRTQATKLYIEEVIIESSKATSFAKHIIESGQLSIPTDTLINSWTKWYLHCGSLNFEIKSDGKYINQSFHCPWSQPDTVEFKDVILSNYVLLKRELKLDSIYQEFWSQLPKGRTYSRSGYGMTYIMTDEQEATWNKDKPRRDYLMLLKDTIDNYLRDELQKQQIVLDDIDCFETYELTFNENGRLCKLKVSYYDKPKLFDGLGWYLVEKREIRKCKKIIKRTFREVNLSSFNLKHKVYRTLSFGVNEEILLRDNTMY